MGILVAIIIILVLIIGAFRLNHHTELALYQPMESANKLRYEAWQAVRGRPIENQETLGEAINISGFACLKLEKDGNFLYVLPPIKNKTN